MSNSNAAHRCGGTPWKANAMSNSILVKTTILLHGSNGLDHREMPSTKMASQ